MKTVIGYNNEGKIIFTMQGTEIKEDCVCIITDVDENKEIISIDLETNTVIAKDKEPTELEKSQIENEILTDKVIELTAQNLINLEEE